ncbi:MAG: OB-fold domain-containing protein [Alphaproteobacteria bacterium]
MGDVAIHFWDGCAAGELRYQCCGTCARAQFYPRPFCAKCGGTQLRWVVSSGFGTVYAATVVGRAPTPEFKAFAPYGLILVDLEEGFRMMAHGDAGLGVGERVCARFHEVGTYHLPIFGRA